MRMRKTLLSGVIALAMVAGFCFSQNAPQNHRYDSTQVLADLRSSDPHTRVEALEQIRSNSATVQNPNVQSALLNLLELETREGNARVREGERRRTEHRHDNSEASDDNAMYLDDLLGVIESFVNWHDPRQICLLAKEGAALDSTDTRESATRAQAALRCLQQLSKSDLFMDRMKAARISVALLAAATGSIDSTTAEAMRQMVTLALRDKRVEVQWEAVDFLERYGRSDMIPALKELADSSSGPNATKDEIGVRKNAGKAIIAIQERDSHQ